MNNCTAVIVTAGETPDRYNNAALDWDTATRSDPFDAWVAQVGDDEVHGDRDALVSRWLLTIWGDVTVNGRNRIEIDGTTYEITGPPVPATRPGGAVHHVECKLELVKG